MLLHFKILEEMIMGKKMEKWNGEIIVKLLIKKDDYAYEIMENSLTATCENAKLQFF